MASNHSEGISDEGFILRNLKGAMYRSHVHPLDEKVLSMATVCNHVVVGTAKQGCKIFRATDKGLSQVQQLGEVPKKEGRDQKLTGGCSCYEVSANKEFLVYIKESAGSCCICVHTMSDVLSGKTAPCRTHDLRARAPMVVEFDLGLIVIGSMAWKASWITEETDQAQGGEECNIRVLSLTDFSHQREFKAASNCVAMLRLQVTPDHSMVGVGDIRAGLKVYDLRQPEGKTYHCLYEVPVEEVKNFQLVGNFVGVFHKFEPNVTFWNMKEQRTILCINIQEQMKQLAKEYCEDEDDDDSGLFDDDDDQVTAVTRVPMSDDFLLVYGTRSGCIFGISVNTRSKVFSIPFPHENVEDQRCRRDVLGIGFAPGGKMIMSFEGSGLTLLDFGLEDPPERPPTRGAPK